LRWYAITHFESRPLNGSPSQNYGVSLAIMRSHSVTFHPTQVNTPSLNPIHTGLYSIYLLRRDGRLSLPGHMYVQSLCCYHFTPILCMSTDSLKRLMDGWPRVVCQQNGGTMT